MVKKGGLLRLGKETTPKIREGDQVRGGDPVEGRERDPALG